MTTFTRWQLLAGGVILLIGLPMLVTLRPVQDSDISAARLLAEIQRSVSKAYSGEVESLGNLQLPVADRFTDVGALFGGRSTLRVWWRSADDWRVDKVLSAGETDLIHDGLSTIEWRYEKGTANRSIDPQVRLPRTADLLPPELTRRLLQDVKVSDLERLPPRRIAGQSALGLRLEPASVQSSIDHVSLWVATASGLPLRVEVYAENERAPSFTSAFTQFSDREPSTDTTTFVPPEGVEVTNKRVLDIADQANRFADVVPPAMLAGLKRSPNSDLAVGVYGTGLTQMIAIPLWGRVSRPLMQQLRTTPGISMIDEGAALTVGPLGVILTDSPARREWLIAGTVDRATLIAAARELAFPETST